MLSYSYVHGADESCCKKLDEEQDLQDENDEGQYVDAELMRYIDACYSHACTNNYVIACQYCMWYYLRIILWTIFKLYTIAHNLYELLLLLLCKTSVQSIQHR